MSKKQEWREKAEKFIDEYPRGADFLPVRMSEAIPDLGEHFYSLHLQELSKIREKICGMKITASGKRDPWSIEVAHIDDRKSYNQALDDILLAITDEK